MSFYWNKLLPAVVGAKQWGDSVKDYIEISKAKMMIKGTPGEHSVITVSTEAFLCLVHENNYEKWVARHKWLNIDKKGDLPPQKGNDNHVVYKCKYTTQKSGQSQYGGWSPEGLKKFNEYRKQIAITWTKDEKKMEEVEKTFLKWHRENMGLACKDAAEERKLNNKRKKRSDDSAAVQPEEQVDTLDGAYGD